MTNSVFDVQVASDLYDAGITEDGENYTAELYYVIVEFQNGRRIRHNTVFKGCKVVKGGEDSDGMIFFEDVRADANRRAEALCERVKEALANGKALDPGYWTEGDPAYGSPAYLDKVATLTPEQRADY